MGSPAAGPRVRVIGTTDDEAPGSPGPLVSVIVPTYDRPLALATCLRALAAQTLAKEQFEVIVCDDGSAAAVAAQHAELVAGLGGPRRVRLVREENAGPAAARNLGAALARGRYLAFTDDDCEPAEDWLASLLARFETNPNALLGGGLRNGLASDVCAAATQAIMDFVYGEQERDSGVRLFSTSNMSMPAAAFRAIGGFSPAFRDAAGEDYDLCWRWHESGWQSVYVPEAVIVHGHSLTVRKYLRQHFSYGRGLFRVRERQRERRRVAARRGPGWYVRLVLSPLRSRRDAAAWRCAALIAVSQAATLAGALVEWVRLSGLRMPSAGAKRLRDRPE